MALTVTPRALDVLRRALATARLDPGRAGVRVHVVRGLRGEEVQTGFAEQPEPGEDTVETGGLRLFVDRALASREATIDVSDEHDRIVVR